jgi:nitrate reductase gamma subunit
MFYSVELQMAGVILLTAMAVGGISLWLKRRKLEKETSESVKEDISENL